MRHKECCRVNSIGKEKVNLAKHIFLLNFKSILEGRIHEKHYQYWMAEQKREAVCTGHMVSECPHVAIVISRFCQHSFLRAVCMKPLCR